MTDEPTCYLNAGAQSAALRWIGILLLLGLLSMPFLALLPATHPLAVSAWLLTLTGKILCYAIVAVALDLVWGYAGMLSLGHGIFFALGGYAMGMYLMRQAAGDGLPAFMSFLSWSELPWFWWGTQHFAWAMLLVVLVHCLTGCCAILNPASGHTAIIITAKPSS